MEFDADEPSVVVFGDSNTFVFGRALRDLLSSRGFPAPQVVVKFRASSSPRHWLRKGSAGYSSTFGELWDRADLRFAGPSVSAALSEATAMVVIGLGGNLGTGASDQKSVERLLDQVHAAAPYARIVWRGPPPATAEKTGKVASRAQKAKRYDKNALLKSVLSGHQFEIFGQNGRRCEHPDPRTYLDLISLHAGGPSKKSKVLGSSSSLAFEEDVLATAKKTTRETEAVWSGPWSSFSHARDAIETHVPLAAAKDFVEAVAAPFGVYEVPDTPEPTPPSSPRFVVTDSDARIRSGPPAFQWTGKRIPVGTIVYVVEESAGRVRVRDAESSDIGWTLASNLETYEEEAPEPETNPEPADEDPETEPTTASEAFDAVWTVVDSVPYLRSGPPHFKKTGKKLRRWSRVRIVEEQDGQARVTNLEGAPLGWTLKTNLGRYFREDPTLIAAPLEPEEPVEIQSSWSRKKKALARTYNRLGGLMDALSTSLQIDVAAALAVWYAESGGKVQTPGRVSIRFENHLFFKRWGKANEAKYNKHFRHGGHNGVEGKSWRSHQWRRSPTGTWRAFHGNQDAEYTVLEFASKLGGRAKALSSISIGGPQILIANHRKLGYSSGSAMYNAFQKGERWHVLGFFDALMGFARKGRNVQRLRAHDWGAFGRAYNGSETYGPKIEAAFKDAKRVLG